MPVLFIQHPQPQPNSIMVNVSRAKSTALSAAPHSAMSECQSAGMGIGSIYRQVL